MRRRQSQDGGSQRIENFGGSFVESDLTQLEERESSVREKS